MILSDISVRRPVLAVVMSLVIVTLGAIGFTRLRIREYPDVDPPSVSINTRYPGAAAIVVENRVTQVIEDVVSGIAGIKSVSSTTQDGSSQIDIEFVLERDVDAAASDVRDRVARIMDRLPDEVDPPEISKANSMRDVSFWMNLSSPIRSVPELTDYAERYLVDRLSTVPGVARIMVGGGGRYSMRIWLDREAMAATGVTAGDVEQTLRRENVELPAGRVESKEREFTVRVRRAYNTAEDFGRLVVGRGDSGHLVRLRDIAKVEIGPSDLRNSFRGLREEMVGLGIIRQEKANSLEVIRQVKEEMKAVNRSMPEDMTLHESYDTSVFIEAAIDEVYKTLGITALVVVLILFLFLGSVRATLVPMVTVPVSLIGTFFVLYAFGFSINLLTLLALVLAIGLVVDDSIVVLENIERRVRAGEPALRAAYLGSRQVAFAVIATTVVLIAVFVPISFLQGNTGRLFSEFALAMAGAVLFSTFVALTLSPAMCARLLRKDAGDGWLPRRVNAAFARVQAGYRLLLGWSMDRPLMVLSLVVVLGTSIFSLFGSLPQEYAPMEDRGSFRVTAIGPEGASFEHTLRISRAIEDVLMELDERGETKRVMVRIPAGYRSSGEVNSIAGTVHLAPWQERTRSTQEIMADVDAKLAELPGYRAFTTARQGLVGRRGQPLQFVITGSTFEELAGWRDQILAKAVENPGLENVDSDYKETKPQFEVVIDTDRAADLGIALQEIGRTLETMMGSRRVTTYIDRGEEYDVILEAEEGDKATAQDMENIYVRSGTTGDLVPLTSVVKIEEFADSSTRNRYDRLRAITITASIAADYSLGEALEFFEKTVADELDNAPGIAYKGQSREFKDAAGAMSFAFVISLLLVFLVLAAQFESFITPLVILLTVPMALFGALCGLLLTGHTLNIYTQIAMVILVGLAAKNGILIVEFANQLRDAGKSIREATLEASVMRLRPILMTGLSTALGSLPLVLASGAGSESRMAIGIVIFAGVSFATVMTLLVIPSVYALVAHLTHSPAQQAQELDRLLHDPEFVEQHPEYQREASA